ncbi:hypothetical protein [Singulisphaera sp. PoT]|uniref:hypothetical protein n=1 Tax=Singulisphaera sp. PoT TaxID=3411797 RepID=UPI003BF4C56A
MSNHNNTSGQKPESNSNFDRDPQSGMSRDVAAEQLREAEESRQAQNSGPSIRERMVDIGRGNQQSGRH